MTGHTFGPYQVLAPLGAGGMGDVYRARDTRLGREVAIKVLRQADATDSDRRRRFEREAQAVAALSHPNIGAIFDIGVHEGQDYLVLELVAGEPLSARVKRGPLDLDEILARARDIAAALSHAHTHGIVHRDLKPGNIMVTPTSTKVLDFGLAAMVGRDSMAPASDVTTTAPLTAVGQIVGTLGYMAPEQIEGRTVDARTDVFAFGATLYEMASGRRAFDATSSAALIGAILRDQPPPLAQLRPDIPLALDRLIRACLEKRPEDRLASMHDAGIALGWIGHERHDTQRPSGRAGKAPAAITRRAFIAGGVGVSGAAVGYILGAWRPRLSPRQPTVVDIAVPEGRQPGAGLALSRDGRRLALSTASGTGPEFGLQLWVRDFFKDEWRRVVCVPHGIGQGRYPFWSPDGQQLAFVVGRRLLRVTPPDGEPVVICEMPEGPNIDRGGAWLTDGTIVMGHPTGGLWVVPLSGGAPREIVPLQADDLALRHPVAVSDRAVVFLALRSSAGGEIRWVDLNAPAHSVVIAASGVSPAYDAGRLYYERQQITVAQACDAAGRLTGDVTRVAFDSLANGLNTGYGQVTAGGGHVAVMNTRPAHQQLAWHYRDGRRPETIGDPMDQSSPRVSPDGRRIVAVRRQRGEGSSLWISDADGTASRRLTSGADDIVPVWSADGRRIVFRSNRGMAGQGNLFEVNADGEASTTPVALRAGSMYPAGWVRDESLMIWSTDSTAVPKIPGLYATKPGTSNDTLLRAMSNVNDAVVSPDGTRVAYSSQESGRREVYVDTVPTPLPAPVQVSRGGGTAPSWRGDGAELYYGNGRTLMAVRMAGTGRLAADAPVKVLDALIILARPDYGPAPDGQRFLLMVPTREAEYSVKMTFDFAAKS